MARSAGLEAQSRNFRLLLQYLASISRKVIDAYIGSRIEERDMKDRKRLL